MERQNGRMEEGAVTYRFFLAATAALLAFFWCLLPATIFGLPGLFRAAVLMACISPAEYATRLPFTTSPTPIRAATLDVLCLDMPSCFATCSSESMADLCVCGSGSTCNGNSGERSVSVEHDDDLLPQFFGRCGVPESLHLLAEQLQSVDRVTELLRVVSGHRSVVSFGEHWLLSLDGDRGTKRGEGLGETLGGAVSISLGELQGPLSVSNPFGLATPSASVEEGRGLEFVLLGDDGVHCFAPCVVLSDVCIVPNGDCVAIGKSEDFWKSLFCPCFVWFSHSLDT